MGLKTMAGRKRGREGGREGGREECTLDVLMRIPRHSTPLPE